MKEKTQKQKEKAIIDVVCTIPSDKWNGDIEKAACVLETEFKNKQILLCFTNLYFDEIPPYLKIDGEEICNGELYNLVKKLKSAIKKRSLEKSKKTRQSINNIYTEFTK